MFFFCLFLSLVGFFLLLLFGCVFFVFFFFNLFSFFIYATSIKNLDLFNYGFWGFFATEF